jgi:hypothetical protein
VRSFLAEPLGTRGFGRNTLPLEELGVLLKRILVREFHVPSAHTLEPGLAALLHNKPTALLVREVECSHGGASAASLLRGLDVPEDLSAQCG